MAVAPFDHWSVPLQPFADNIVLLPEQIVPPPFTSGTIGLGLIVTFTKLDVAWLQDPEPVPLQA